MSRLRRIPGADKAREREQGVCLTINKQHNCSLNAMRSAEFYRQKADERVQAAKATTSNEERARHCALALGLVMPRETIELKRAIRVTYPGAPRASLLVASQQRALARY